jgi:hypothetical protein
MSLVLPGLTMLTWAVLLAFGLDADESRVPFLVAESLALLAQARTMRDCILNGWPWE